MDKKLITEQWIQKSEKRYNNKYDYSKVIYFDNKTKVCIICPEHGEFWQSPNNHLNSKFGCPKCAKESTKKKLSLTTEEFIIKAKEVHGDKYDYSKTKYINSTTKVCIICPKHGEFWQVANCHLQGGGCLKCKYEYVSNLQRGNINTFIEKANIIHHNKYDYSKSIYGKNNKEKITIICPKHGEFLQSPHDHLSGYGCPKCHLKSQTKLYEKLKESFPNEEILFEVGRKIVNWLDEQRIDIYFPKYNIAIEYNGEQHYIPIEYFGGQLELENTIKRDKLKETKCKQNNCTLFQIKYNYTNQDYNNLENNIKKIINNYGN